MVWRAVAWPIVCQNCVMPNCSYYRTLGTEKELGQGRRWRPGGVWRGIGRGGRGHSGGWPQVRRLGRAEEAAARDRRRNTTLALTEKLVVYATGHRLEYGDRDAVEKVVAQTREQKYGLAALVHAVVQSELFLNK